MFPSKSVSIPKIFILHYWKKFFLTKWLQEPNLSIFLSIYMLFLTGSIFDPIEVLFNVLSKQTATRYEDYACKQGGKIVACRWRLITANSVCFDNLKLLLTNFSCLKNKTRQAKHMLKSIGSR